MDKQVIGVYSSIEAAKNKAAFIAMEDEASGIGHYAEGPGITYSADSGVLFRGLRENAYCLWVEEFELDK